MQVLDFQQKPPAWQVFCESPHLSTKTLKVLNLPVGHGAAVNENNVD